MAPFRSTLSRSVGKLLGVYRERDSSLRGFQGTRFISPDPILAEYVFFGSATGTISVPGETTRLEIAGVAGGGGGKTQDYPGGGWNSAGGGAGSNIRGNFFPLGGASTIYYSVSGDATAGNSGGATFVKQTNSGGTDIFRLGGGGAGTGDGTFPNSGGAGGTVPGGGPNAVAGGAGGNGSPPPGSNRTGQVVGNFGTAGGGGGGGHNNNNLSGFDGADGGSSTVPSDPEADGGALESNGVGPAPSTWKFKRGTTSGGSAGTGGPGTGNGTTGSDVGYAAGGGGGEGAAAPQGGGGGGGGGGAGIAWDDPTSPENNSVFGGGGGGSGYSSPQQYYYTPTTAASISAGGRGVLVIRFRSD